MSSGETFFSNDPARMYRLKVLLEAGKSTRAAAFEFGVSQGATARARRKLLARNELDLPKSVRRPPARKPRPRPVRPLKVIDIPNPFLPPPRKPDPPAPVVSPPRRKATVHRRVSLPPMPDLSNHERIMMTVPEVDMRKSREGAPGQRFDSRTAAAAGYSEKEAARLAERRMAIQHRGKRRCADWHVSEIIAENRRLVAQSTVPVKVYPPSVSRGWYPTWAR